MSSFHTPSPRAVAVALADLINGAGLEVAGYRAVAVQASDGVNLRLVDRNEITACRFEAWVERTDR